MGEPGEVTPVDGANAVADGADTDDGDAPAVWISALTGDGLEELRASIRRRLAEAG